MKTFYELLPDGTIGLSTPDEKIAKHHDLSLATEKEIVYGCDGKRYFKGDEPAPPEPGYVEKRLAEYPPLGDMIDAICKHIAGSPDELAHLMAHRQNIKNAYPKP